MGIKSANKFLLDNCSKKAIYKALFSQFTGKTIVIDTMIFIFFFPLKCYDNSCVKFNIIFALKPKNGVNIFI